MENEMETTTFGGFHGECIGKDLGEIGIWGVEVLRRVNQTITKLKIQNVRYKALFHPVRIGYRGYSMYTA